MPEDTGPPGLRRRFWLLAVPAALLALALAVSPAAEQLHGLLLVGVLLLLPIALCAAAAWEWWTGGRKQD